MMKIFIFSVLMTIGVTVSAIANDNISFSVDFPSALGDEQDGLFLLFPDPNDLRPHGQACQGIESAEGLIHVDHIRGNG